MKLNKIEKNTNITKLKHIKKLKNYNNYDGWGVHWWGFQFFMSTSTQNQTIDWISGQGGMANVNIAKLAAFVMRFAKVAISLKYLLPLLTIYGVEFIGALNDQDGSGVVIDDSWEITVPWFHSQSEYVMNNFTM